MEEEQRKRRGWYRNKYTAEDKRYHQNYNYERKYGITLDEYNEMVEKQKGCCLICGKHQDTFKTYRKGNNKKLFVDHNHKTGEIRGLLCYDCNVMLGYACEDIDILKNAINYCEEHKIEKLTKLDKDMMSLRKSFKNYEGANAKKLRSHKLKNSSWHQKSPLPSFFD